MQPAIAITLAAACQGRYTGRMVEWIQSKSPVGYAEAVRTMEARVAAIRAGEADEAVWLLEHPPLYTAGSSARPADLLDARFPVHRTGRGGQYTYHGPGQRVAYVMLDLLKRGGEAGPDLRAYVQALEGWLIATLAEFGVTGHIRDGRVGVWVETPQGDAKIAALGVRVRRGVSYHGVALNVSPDLSHFAGIVPCGLSGYGVTSLKELGMTIRHGEVDRMLEKCFGSFFA